MANPSPPPIPILLLLLIISSANAVTSTTIFQELEDTLQSLRNHGYTLFTNAITTSDLQYQLLTTDPGATSTSFTLFAPKDELLYALDLASDAAVYVSTLRYHVVPNMRHTFTDLQNLSSPFLETLLPHYSLLVGKIQHDDVSYENATVGVMVDGVRVSDPDLFIGSRFVVHGIDGVLLTGLNLNTDFISDDNPPEIFPPVESPAPVLDAYTPAEGSGYGNILAEESHTPASEYDWNSDPTSPAITFYGNVPAEETLTPSPSHFDWGYVETDPIEYSPWHENIPVSATLKIFQDERRRSPPRKSRGRKKRGKRHRTAAQSPEAKGAISSPSLFCKLPAILVVWIFCNIPHN